MPDQKETVSYEQIKDHNNNHFGFIVRWCLQESPKYGVMGITGEVYEITSTSIDPKVNGFPVGPFGYADGDLEPDAIEENHELSDYSPSFKIYMKSDGCTHLWFSSYNHICTHEGTYELADMIKYMTRRAAYAIDIYRNPLLKDKALLPIQYNEPEFEAIPYVPNTQ